MHRDLIVDNMIYDSGTEGDCVWSVDINGRKWTVTVEKNGEIKTESFYGYEPRFGVDVEDANRVEELLERFIREFESSR